MSVIERSCEVAAPAEVVWSILEDVRRLPEVSASTVEVSGAPARLTHVGDTFRQVVVVLGRRFESDWVVLALDPRRCLQIEGDVGYGARYRLTERVVDLGAARSRLSVCIEYRLPFGPLGRLAGRLGIEQRAAREASDVLAGVKRVAEAANAR